MPRGDKSKYTAKQDRQAEHIEEGYEKKGMSKGRAEGIAWATVNKIHGGGKKGGSGEGKKPDYSRSTSEKRRTAALKGWETRRRKKG
jgi:hypothetical protein